MERDQERDQERDRIIFVGTSDLSGHFRGKSFPAADLAARLVKGVGVAPSNIYLSAFGPIQMTTFGTLGEVFLIPDPAARVCLAFDGAAGGGDAQVGAGTQEEFYLGDFKTLAGAPWDFCPRQILRRALERLAGETGLVLLAAFEQEFTYSGADARSWQPYSLAALRRQGLYGESLLAALRQAGVTPDSFLAEYGPAQYEVTVAPTRGLRAADEAVITREVAQAVALRCGQRVSFTPLAEPAGVTSGTHIHFSLWDREGRPVLYDAERANALSELGAQFVAGIQRHLPALCAVTAPSVPSYYRLRPNGWAPTRADVGVLDRGVALRLCPAAGGSMAERARSFNVEFRVADATASPYLALAALVQAGLEGIRQRRTIGAAQPAALPDSLDAALSLLEAHAEAGEWLGAAVLPAYVAFKRAEIASLEGADEAEVCRLYAAAY